MNQSSRPPLPSLPEGITPVIVWQIPPDHICSEGGKIAYKLEDIDGDCFGARSEDHMKELLIRLGCDGITHQQMQLLRRRRLTLQRWKARRERINKGKRKKP